MPIFSVFILIRIIMKIMKQITLNYGHNGEAGSTCHTLDSHIGI